MVIKPLSLAHGNIIITVIGVNERYIRRNYPVTIRGIVASIPLYSLCTSRKLHSFLDLLHQLIMSAFGCTGAGCKTECQKDKQPLHPCSVSQDVDVRN